MTTENAQPMAKSADDLVREAADVVRPILARAVEELGLGAEGAERLMLRIAEAYLQGRGDGADAFARQVNRTLSANGIAAAVSVRHVTVRPRGAQ